MNKQQLLNDIDSIMKSTTDMNTNQKLSVLYQNVELLLEVKDNE